MKLNTATQETLHQVANEVIANIVARCGKKETYWVCRIYANEETNWGERTEAELFEFLTYNSVMRFGCALIVEGVCYYKGYFRMEDIPELERWVTEFYNLDVKKGSKDWCQVVSSDNKAYFTNAYKLCKDFIKEHNLSLSEFKIVHIDRTRQKVDISVLTNELKQVN